MSHVRGRSQNFKSSKCTFAGTILHFKTLDFFSVSKTIELKYHAIVRGISLCILQVSHIEQVRTIVVTTGS